MGHPGPLATKVGDFFGLAKDVPPVDADGTADDVPGPIGGGQEPRMGRAPRLSRSTRRVGRGGLAERLACRRLRGWCGHLTAPKVRPWTSCLWQNQPKTTIGAQERVDTAESFAQNKPSGLE